MKPAVIANARPKPLGAPSDWKPDQNGHCSALFVRDEEVNGVHYMRSAWEVDAHEAALLYAGARLTLGIAGNSHPVVQLGMTELPVDFEPVVHARRFAALDGKPMVRVEMLFAHGGGRRGFTEIPRRRDAGRCGQQWHHANRGAGPAGRLDRMTVIATDGRTMAADGRLTEKDLIVTDRAEKLFHAKDGSVVGCAGDCAAIVLGRRWFERGEQEEKLPVMRGRDFEALVLRPDGRFSSSTRSWHPSTWRFRPPWARAATWPSGRCWSVQHLRSLSG
jgi:hypothetical protein